MDVNLTKFGAACTKTIAAAALAAVSLTLIIPPVPASAQTQGMERREDRRDDRGEARDTRQQGRDDARDQKQECKDAGGNRMDCRQEKRDTKQDARQDARDVKTND